MCICIIIEYSYFQKTRNIPRLRWGIFLSYDSYLIDRLFIILPSYCPRSCSRPRRFPPAIPAGSACKSTPVDSFMRPQSGLCCSLRPLRALWSCRRRILRSYWSAARGKQYANVFYLYPYLTFASFETFTNCAPV